MDSPNSKYIKEVEKSYTSLQYFLKLSTCIAPTTVKNRGKSTTGTLTTPKSNEFPGAGGKNLAKNSASDCNSAESTEGSLVWPPSISLEEGFKKAILNLDKIIFKVFIESFQF